ncbi:aldose 1-epimerase family protein [Microbacterium sp. ARD32]|uniref:aldose 1-epimerase family protein n=1 Tax=Microbacterium sp. ARD32 TaxID=2962577 RepID=UPI0028811E89|nr:aldose 1-epimerase family protein [Microbacterium sp. ARD32]MDT0156097.1 aldose 1-epimerase family protein [Microbacterium sp. ARD32]
MASDRAAHSPTGIQIRLQRGDVTAQIAQVGASLRHLTVGGVDIVPPYPEDAPTPGASGVVLAPWPNRIRDGVWQDGGTTRALAVTEPKFRNASHGLLRFTAYEIVAQTDDAVTLAASIVPQTGYPYLVETTVRYALTDAGVEVTHTLTNRSAAAAPVALGTHPYLTIGDADPRTLVLRIPAETYFETDERMLPVGESPVSAGTDLREGRRLGDVQLDTGYANLRRDVDGFVRATLTAPDGRAVTLQQGPGFGYVQAYTSTGYPGRDLVVAVEPMTAPADAFNSGRGVRRLALDESWTLEWGIRFSS